MDHGRVAHSRRVLSAGVSASALAALIGVGLTAGWASPALAADAAAADQRTGVLEEIVVTARKREESLQEAPLSISATSGATLEKAQIRQINDISQFAPAVTLTQTVGFPANLSIFIRGIGNAEPILTVDSPVAVYVDGVYLGRSAATAANLVDVDRLEVLRGPQGTLFGRNTTGGAISIVTKAPTQDFGVEQRLSYGSNQEINSVTTLNTGRIAGAPITAKLTYQHHQMNGYWRNTLLSKKHSQGADNTDELSLAVRIEPTDDFTIDYKFDYRSQILTPQRFQILEASPAFLNYFGRSPSLGGAAITTPSQDRQDSYQSFNDTNGKVRVKGHSLTLNYTVSDALRFKSITAYRALFTSSATDLTGSGQLRGLASVCPPFTPGCPVPATVQNVYAFFADTDRQNQYQRSEEFQVLGHVGDFDYVAGLYYFDEHVGEYAHTFITLPLVAIGFPNIAPFNTQGLITESITKYSGSAISRAAFGQVSWSPSALDGRLELTGGLRYTEDGKTLDQLPPDFTGGPNGRRLRSKFDDFSQSASVKYKWTEDIMTFARYSKAYKSGGYSARAAINGASAQSAFKPEKAKTYEIGAKTELWDRRVRLNAAIFQTDYKDLQVNSTAGSTTGFQTLVFNAASARYRGGEVELTVLPATGWQINGSFGYVDPKYNEYIQNVPSAPGSTVLVPIDISKLVHFVTSAKTTASASVEYAFPATSFGALTLRADWTYTGPRYTTEGKFANGTPSGTAVRRNPPGFTPITELSKSKAFNNVGAQIILDHVPLGMGGEWQLAAFGRNLLNNHYQLGTLDLTDLGLILDSWGRGRSFGVSATAKF